MSESKIPIQNIYFILCYAWKQLDEAKRINVSVSDYKLVIDLFAKVLKNGCAYILKRGLDRAYKPEIEEFYRLRGKLDFNQSIRNIAKKSNRFFCQYDDLSYDILHNQIIKASINKVLKVDQLDRNIRKELLEVYKKFLNVSDIDLTSNHFTRVNLHRNNLFYRLVLNVARIIHDNIVLDEETGKYEFVDFVRDDKKMAVVFENFIRNFYKEHLLTFGYEVKPEILHWDVTEADQFAIDYLPVMKTDISITSASRKIIIDTKYYKECFQEHYDKKALISGHFYQLIEYLENSDAQSHSNIKSEGILLYPAVTFYDSIPFKVLRGHKVTVRMINLNQEWRKISEDLLGFIN